MFKKIVKKIKATAEKLRAFVSNVIAKVLAAKARVTPVLAGTRAENYVDSGVKILIAVVIGALLLAGLYTLFNTTIMPTVTGKITELFGYSG